ncbi:hypothetical protein CQ062_22385 [Ochrobactrum sp. MYb68]|nr:hypothetical protein CQ062_22385 [Ochrobactrum sp. MYb68]
MQESAEQAGRAQAERQLPAYPDDCRKKVDHAPLIDGAEVRSVLKRERRRLLDRMRAQTDVLIFMMGWRRYKVMGDDIKWLIGLATGLGGTFTVALIATFRSLSSSIREGDNQLHERVNRVRDEYVRRVDLDDHVKQLRDSVRELRDETREASRGTNTRLDQVLAVLAQDKK